MGSFFRFSLVSLPCGWLTVGRTQAEIFVRNADFTVRCAGTFAAARYRMRLSVALQRSFRTPLRQPTRVTPLIRDTRPNNSEYLLLTNLVSFVRDSRVVYLLSDPK